MNALRQAAPAEPAASDLPPALTIAAAPAVKIVALLVGGALTQLPTAVAVLPYFGTSRGAKAPLRKLSSTVYSFLPRS